MTLGRTQRGTSKASLSRTAQLCIGPAGNITEHCPSIRCIFLFIRWEEAPPGMAGTGPPPHSSKRIPAHSAATTREPTVTWSQSTKPTAAMDGTARGILSPIRTATRRNSGPQQHSAQGAPAHLAVHALCFKELQRSSHSLASLEREHARSCESGANTDNVLARQVRAHAAPLNSAPTPNQLQLSREPSCPPPCNSCLSSPMCPHSGAAQPSQRRAIRRVLRDAARRKLMSSVRSSTSSVLGVLQHTGPCRRTEVRSPSRVKACGHPQQLPLQELRAPGRLLEAYPADP
jgi:hypothetical protein